MSKRIAVPGGFIQEQEHLEGRCYVLTGPRQPGLKQVMTVHGAEFIRLSQSAGWKVEDLSFLEELTFLRGVDVFHWEVRDISVLKKLPQLELVRLECQFKGFDFSCFPRLRLLSVRWRPGCESLFACSSLELLFMDGYPERDLRPLSRLSRLERLYLRSRPLASLDGLEHLPRLRHLQFVDCTALSDITALRTARELRQVEFTSCKKLVTIDALGGLPCLEKLMLDCCGSITSVHPLKVCDRLAELYLIGTTVEDGDLQPLLEMRSLRKVAIAKSRKHSHTAEQINEALARR